MRLSFGIPVQAVVVAALTCLSAVSSALTHEDQAHFNSTLGAIYNQGMKLAAQGSRSCPNENKKLNAVKDLRISIYYGYWNTEKLVLDGGQAAAMAAALQAPCPPNLEACGFKIQLAAPFRTILSKRVGSRKITLTVAHTSISSNGADNQDLNKTGGAQDQQSATIEKQFNHSLIHDDVVFYSGHARYGGGLGFRKDSFVGDAMNVAFRAPIRPMANALRARPTRLKVLGLFTCESDRHYRYIIEDTNPHTNMIITHGDILSVEGDQTMLGAVNSILMNKCDADFRESLVSTVVPQSKIIEYVRRPE